MRENAEGSVFVEFMDPQSVLSLVTLEALAGAPRERWSALLGELEKDDLAELVRATFVDQSRSSLLLEPR